MVSPASHRFILDQHPWDECRVLNLLREFCGRDLAESRGMRPSNR